MSLCAPAEKCSMTLTGHSWMPSFECGCGEESLDYEGQRCASKAFVSELTESKYKRLSFKVVY